MTNSAEFTKHFELKIFPFFISRKLLIYPAPSLLGNLLFGSTERPWSYKRANVMFGQLLSQQT